ncbi:hypothetical protein D3C87_645660 [compost metagenome]
MTTYDEIFTQFLSINKTDPINIPVEDDPKYDMIHNGVHHFNNRMRDELKFDDGTEVLDRLLNFDEIIILTRFMRLTFLENQLTEFSTLYQPFAADIGLKNYQSQVKALESLVERENNKIEGIIDNMQEDYI